VEPEAASPGEPAPRILYEDAEMVVIYRPAPQGVVAQLPPFTLVTFAELTFRPDGHSVWGQEPAARLGLPVIGFVAKRENWFPAASVTRAAPALRALLEGSQALAYGYSMGGYAALKYARMLGIGRVLAICPQASINPLDVPTDKRFHKFFERGLHAHMRPLPSDAPEFAVMMADPYMEDDRVNATLLATPELGIHWLRTPFVGHASIWLLAETEFLQKVLEMVMAADMATLSLAMRDRRHHSPQWFFRVGVNAFVRGRYHLAARLWDRAEQIGLHRSTREQEVMHILSGTISRMVSKGRKGEAHRMVLHLTEVHGNDAVVLAQIGHILIGMGEGDMAEEPFRASLALRKDVQHVYQGLSLVLGGKGKREEALAIAEQGIREAPGDAALHIHLGFMLLNFARLEDAETQFNIVLSQMPDHVGALIGKSHVLGAYGRQAEAVQVVKQTLPLAPHDAGNRTWLGQLLLVIGQPAEAEEHFRVAVEHAPDNGAAHIGLARSLERTGRLDEARHVAADAAAALPHDARVQAIHRRMGPATEPRPAAVAEEVDQRSGLRRFLSAFFSRS
jgi:Flp pilus assembly protein TadD